VTQDETKYVGGPIPSKLKDQIEQQCGDFGLKVGRVVVAMSRLWADLPPDLQMKLYQRINSSENFLDLLMGSISDAEVQA